MRLPERAYVLLPDALRAITSEISTRHERDTVLTAALPVCAGALPHVQFRYGDHAQSVNLYAIVVAPPGSGKGHLRHARTLGAPIQERRHREHREALEAFQNSGSDEDDREPPTFRHFFLPADASAAAMKAALANDPHGVVFDTEVGTLETALSKGWGGYGDVLLKGFHNEAVEVNRRSDAPTLISRPAPSIVLAGTPDRVRRVVAGRRDGLFSRFLFYEFEAPRRWRSQFGDEGPSEAHEAARRLGEQLDRAYRQLQKREEPVQIRFSEATQRWIDGAYEAINDRWRRRSVPDPLFASLKRSALKAVRMSAILTLVRVVEAGKDLRNGSHATVMERHVECALHLALTYLAHALRIRAPEIRDDPRAQLTEAERTYLSRLPGGTFSTDRAREIAEELGLEERTMYRRLRSYAETDLLVDVGKGTWSKPGPAEGSEAAAVPGLGAVQCVRADLDPGGADAA